MYTCDFSSLLLWNQCYQTAFTKYMTRHSSWLIVNQLLVSSLSNFFARWCMLTLHVAVGWLSNTCYCNTKSNITLIFLTSLIAWLPVSLRGVGFPFYRPEPAVSNGKQGCACSGFRGLTSLCQAFREVLFPLVQSCTTGLCQWGQRSRKELELFSRSGRVVILLVLSCLSPDGSSVWLDSPVGPASWCKGTPRSSRSDCSLTGT